jgi:HEAT repeat protein
VCTGKAEASRGYNLGVDNVILAKVGPEAWSRSAGRRPPADRLRGATVPELAKALSDGDPIVRGLAALGLKEAGLAALPALSPLVARLADSDVGVRMMAANAIAAIGPKAAPAVPALVAAAGVRDEHVHVLRSVADALGSIGPAAASALPALEEIRKLPRARWAAEAAIRKIR